jgi:hypothetical protein
MPPLAACSTEPPSPPDALSRALLALSDDPQRERIRVGDLLLAMQDQALATLILFFALPNLLPVPPGTSGVLGVPLLFLAAQLALGLPAWLPAPIAARSISRERFAALTRRLLPWLARVEPLLRPRWPALSAALPVRLAGLLCFVLAAVLALPVPLGNMAPAFAISVMMLGVLRHDGAWLLAGAAAGVAALGIAVAVIWAGLQALPHSALP